MHDDKNYLLQTITLDVLLLDKEETRGDKDQKMQKKKDFVGFDNGFSGRKKKSVTIVL